MTITKLSGVIAAICTGAAALGATVNSSCPVSGQDISPDVQTATWKDQSIGFCCPDCKGTFEGWSNARKDSFLVAALTATMEGDDKAKDAKPMPGSNVGDPYTLATCPVSGQRLGSMGDPVVREYDGREVRFCCDGCIDRFEKNQAAYWEKIDQQMIADQTPSYPAENCVISGEPLHFEGEDQGVDIVFNNRLVRLCCKGCKGDFAEDPGAYITVLDNAAADQQRDDYPMDTCIISGGRLGGMGEPYELVIANRLIRLCCEGCEGKVMAAPAEHIATLDAAWRTSRSDGDGGRDADAKKKRNMKERTGAGDALRATPN